MKKHSKPFKILSFFFCLVFLFIGSRTDVFAIAVNTTTSYNCPRGLCSRKLIIDGPYGRQEETINSSIPYLGGKTYSQAYDIYSPYTQYKAKYHLYVIYCPKYSYSDSSLLRHTMTMVFAQHGYTVTGYSQYNQNQHYINMICDHATDFQGKHLYAFGQNLCGENAMISVEDLEGLAEEYQVTTGCGLSNSELENHTWIFGKWESSGTNNHSRTKTCSECGYSTNEIQAHTYTNSNYRSIDSTTHKSTKKCSACGHSEDKQENHIFNNGNWETVNSLYHRRSKICSKCLYLEYETANHRDNNGDLMCDDCSYAMPIFSVTVPTTMNITMSKDGTVYAADNADIQNNSNAAVKVTSVEITGKNGWTVVPYSTNMANEKVDCKKVGFKINNISADVIGQATLNGNWSIEANTSLPLNYAAVISATSSPIVNKNILDVKFIVEWK